MPDAVPSVPISFDASTEATAPKDFVTPEVPIKGRLTVPGGIRKPHADITRSMIWIYGEPKIGKTTLAASFPGVWFIATEKGQDWVEIREPTLVSSWDEFLELCAYIEENKPTHFGDGTPIRAICIDTVDLLFKMCNDQVCVDMGVSDPGEIPHGGGWGRLSKEFERVMSKIRRWPYGLICISHVRQKEFKSKGRKWDRYEPNIGAAGMRWCLAAADIILYAHVSEEVEKNANGEVTGKIIEHRVAQCHPSSTAVAGGRMANRLPAMIPLNYGELIKHFPGTDPNFPA